MGMPYGDDDMEALGKKKPMAITISVSGGDDDAEESSESPEMEASEGNDDEGADKALIDEELKKRLAGLGMAK